MRTGLVAGIAGSAASPSAPLVMIKRPKSQRVGAFIAVAECPAVAVSTMAFADLKAGDGIDGASLTERQFLRQSVSYDPSIPRFNGPAPHCFVDSPRRCGGGFRSAPGVVRGQNARR